MFHSCHFRFSFAGTSFYKWQVIEILVKFIILSVSYSSFKFSCIMSMFRFDKLVRIGVQTCLHCLDFAAHSCTFLFLEVAIESK